MKKAKVRCNVATYCHWTEQDAALDNGEKYIIDRYVSDCGGRFGLATWREDEHMNKCPKCGGTIVLLCPDMLE